MLNDTWDFEFAVLGGTQGLGWSGSVALHTLHNTQHLGQSGSTALGSKT